MHWTTYVLCSASLSDFKNTYLEKIKTPIKKGPFFLEPLGLFFPPDHIDAVATFHFRIGITI